MNGFTSNMLNYEAKRAVFDSIVIPYEGSLVIVCCIIFGLLLASVYDILFCSYTVLYHCKGNELAFHVRQKCESLFWFNPTPYLFEGNLQTCFTVFFSKPEYSFERTHLDTEEGGIISIDFFPAMDSGLKKCKKFVVVLHGLSGGSKDQYVQSLIKHIVLENSGKSEAEMIYCAIVHGRGCGETVIKSPLITYAAFTKDIRFAVKWLHDKCPDAKMVMVGYSLGGSILTNYLGEESVTAEGYINGAISVGCPYDLYGCGLELQSNSWKRFIYSTTMKKNVFKLLSKFENIFSSVVEFEKLKSTETMWELDGLLTSKLTGFTGAGIYYREASATRKIHHVGVPLLCISAEDDPVTPGKYLLKEDFENNPNICLAVTSKGGHLGWFSGQWPKNNWIGKTVTEAVIMMFKPPFSEGAKMRKSVPLSPSVKHKRFIAMTRLILLYYIAKEKKTKLERDVNSFRTANL